MTRLSLRGRLTLIILLPLLAVAGLISALTLRDAQDRALELFDRSLLSTALAISRDIAVSGGDALSARTLDQLRDTSGGPVFYHVFAPDGAFVTGYATPPVPPKRGQPSPAPEFYYAQYLGNDVRVLRMQDAVEVDGLAGIYTFAVWQNVSIRDQFVLDFAKRAFLITGVLLLSVALIVWFGVGHGLRPLLDLEEAIARRSPEDLEPIRRPVPSEVQSLVATLNRLLTQVSDAIEARDAFVHRAAHQLRNPIAGVVALAEAVLSARTSEDTQERALALKDAADQTGRLANSLLLFERARSVDVSHRGETLALDPALEALVGEVSQGAPAGVSVTFDGSAPRAAVFADAVLLIEAVRNLVDNAILHGGPDLTTVRVRTVLRSNEVAIEVADDGKGISEQDMPIVMERFGQATPGQGSGLGLSIAEAVAKQHGGRLELLRREPGLTARMTLPLVSSPERSASVGFSQAAQ